ncbi:uncharacterized protein LOC127787526 [Diospyros lotus]|uniref:uncharacterized protein LOC127787526 n=1 Tax=Diospyros lotus TaxID=55363 RepID=UPI002252EA74|nr:uncharacterized protein LOC127787526 [Diospyros lotus]
MRTTKELWLVLLLVAGLLVSSSMGFESDELLLDDEEFGLEGAARSPRSDDIVVSSTSSSSGRSSGGRGRRRSSDRESESDSRVQFRLEHAFGDYDSHFSPAGNFTARLKTWSHGGQTLTKLRFSRETFTETEKEKFKKLLEADDFYRIRVPSYVLSPPGRDYIVSSVKARCLPRDRLDEHFVIHMEGVNILAVNYGSPGACPYPRQLKFPAKWSFNSHSVLKNSEQAPRTPAFVEESLLGDNNGDIEGVKPPERSFWAKYWMYLIPLGIIVMNAITQAMNMPEEQASGQSASQTQQPTPAAQRGQGAALRRR